MIDLLIPVYNEGDNITRVLEALRESVRSPFRVIICYDSDEDNTLAAIKRWDTKGLEIILVKNNYQGVHGAIMTGFKTSLSEAVIVFPADDTYNGGRIDDMIHRFQAGAEIVSASRFMKGGCMEGCPWLKAILVRSASFLLYHFAKLPTSDATNGFRLFSRRVLSEITIESTAGFAFSIELLVKCHRLGWRIDEVPASWFERRQGKSRFKIFKWLPIYLRWFFYGFSTSARRLTATFDAALFIWSSAVFCFYISWVIWPKIEGHVRWIF